MPATPWEEVIGKRCEICGNWATHYYGLSVICCDCHAGPGEGLVTAEEAQHMNAGKSPATEESGDGA